ASATPHTVTASYSGNSNFQSSSANIAQTVNKANTTTVAHSVAVAAGSDQVTFTATVSAVAPGSGTPAGTVQFNIDGSPFGSPVTLSGGSATSGNTTTPLLGTHTASADFTDTDNNFNISTGSMTEPDRHSTAADVTASTA